MSYVNRSIFGISFCLERIGKVIAVCAMRLMAIALLHCEHEPKSLLQNTLLIQWTLCRIYPHVTYLICPSSEELWSSQSYYRLEFDNQRTPSTANKRLIDPSHFT